ncbi:hypothetical protein [Streptomyces cinereoruber]|uniref:hypothetical protein n=1 Tax=Streptomyces cinereoruber TaxID=67260 RepID=UPI003647BCE0
MTIRTSIAAGTTTAIATLIANYQCGHCISTTELINDAHLLIHHDDHCPVLTGTLSATPDVLRATGGQS